MSKTRVSAIGLATALGVGLFASTAAAAETTEEFDPQFIFSDDAGVQWIFSDDHGDEAGAQWIFSDDHGDEAGAQWIFSVDEWY